MFCQEDRLFPDDDLASGDFRPPARSLLGGVNRLVPQVQENHKNHEKDSGHARKARPARATPPGPSGCDH